MSMQKWYLIILIILSVATRVVNFGYPNQTVFDEVLYGSYVTSYELGNAYVDTHPPLSKVLIFGTAKLGGINTDANFGAIGKPYPDARYVYMRLLPLLFGCLLPILVYFLARAIKLSSLSSFIAGLLIVFENSFIVQSQFILTDNFMLVFGFSALLAYVISKRTTVSRPRWWFVGALVCAGLALSIKWLGVSFLGMIGLLELYWLYHRKPSWSTWAGNISLMIVVPLFIYYLSFVAHFMILGQSISPMHAIEMNKELVSSNFSQTPHHPYESAWYERSLMIRPILYWEGKIDDASNSMSYLAFFGNPFAYWVGALAIIFLFGAMLVSNTYRNNKIVLFIMVGFVIHWLPYMFIHRHMFLYHYMAALVFSVYAIGYCLDAFVPKKYLGVVLVTLGCVMVSGFVFASPFTYGIPMTPEVRNSKYLLPSWQPKQGIPMPYKPATQ
jgi:dolichyl-phosphate-mannose-protein mannosyltransferase